MTLVFPNILLAVMMYFSIYLPIRAQDLANTGLKHSLSIQMTAEEVDYNSDFMD